MGAKTALSLCHTQSSGPRISMRCRTDFQNNYNTSHLHVWCNAMWLWCIGRCWAIFVSNITQQKWPQTVAPFIHPKRSLSYRIPFGSLLFFFLVDLLGIRVVTISFFSFFFFLFFVGLSFVVLFFSSFFFVLFNCFLRFTDLMRLSFGVVNGRNANGIMRFGLPTPFRLKHWALGWSAFHSSQHHLSLKLWNRVEEIMRYDKTN